MQEINQSSIVPSAPSKSETLQSSQTLGKLFEALSKAQGKMEPAELDCTNPHYQSKYASLKSIRTAARAPLSENNLSVLQQVFSNENVFFVRTVLGHSSGEWISNTFKILIDKNNMQGLGSSVTYARRYGVSALIGIVDTEDDDGNAASTQIKPKPKNHAPQTAAAASARPPQTEPLDEALMEEEAKQHNLMHHLFELVEMRQVPRAHMPELIKLVVGRATKSDQLSIAELESVISHIKENFNG